MKILIQQACILDTQSSHHRAVKDILVEKGIIQEIGDRLSVDADQKIDGNGVFVSPGWVDVFSNFADPGYEFKETLETGAQAAAGGGYTDVFVIPNTKPPIDTKAQVEYIRQKTKSLPVNVWPIGAITKSLEGRELAEMYDMHSSGAVAFGDGILPIQSAGLLLKALQYVKSFNGVVMQIPDDKSIGANGLINEGIISTQLGLPGKPMMAEELIIARDIKLAGYTSSKIHFTGISSPRSLDYIRRAKDSGLEVTCSVTPYHLSFTDRDLVEYDTNLKVYPPLRTQTAVEALRQGVLDGTIDCIATHHLPHEFDSKVLEFEYAKFGMTGLETSYAVLKWVFTGITEERVVELLSTSARKIFSLANPKIEKGQRACLTLFNPGSNWQLTSENSRSKSRNTPFLGKTFTGRPIGIINGEKLFLNT
ncbi:MAG: dihydroorotase [Bacteroidetes bacterium]|nr:MAG: dihydroorotase [Bacteroidota bacterium]